MATFKPLLEGTAITKEVLRKAGCEAEFQTLESVDDHRRVLTA
jgi:hypothetical protein